MAWTSRVVVKSARPMPVALPCVRSVRPRTKISRMAGWSAGGLVPKGALAADDVGVHSRSADVLADLVHDEQVGLPPGQPGQQPPRLAQQLFLARLEVLRRDGLDEGGLVVGVLDHGQAEGDGGAGAQGPADGAHDGVEGLFQQDAVVGQGAGVLAEADHHHLEQAALDGAVKAGVRLDAGHDADVVGLRGEAVEQDRIAFGRGAQRDHLHRGADGGADEFLGDAVAFEDARAARRPCRRRGCPWPGPGTAGRRAFSGRRPSRAG